MSTKTSIKRIALVAVSALGFGLLSVVPAKADEATTAEVVNGSLSISAASGNTFSVGSTVSMNLNLAETANEVIAAGDTVKLRSAITTVPGSSGVPNLTATAVTPVAATKGTVAANTAGPAPIVKLTFTEDADTDAGGNADTAVTLGTTATKFAGVTFTPTVVGSYTLTLWHDANDDGLITSGEARNDQVIIISSQGVLSQIDISTSTTVDRASAVSLSSAFNSARVGTPVSFTPKVTLTADADGGGITAGEFGVTLKYSLAKPSGSSASLDSGTQTLSSAAVSVAGGVDTAGTAQSASVIEFTPDVAGTYTVTAWHDADNDGLVDNGEASGSLAVVIAADAPVLTIKAYNSTALAGDFDTNFRGALVRLTLTNGGVAASLSASEKIRVSVDSGSIELKSTSSASSSELSLTTLDLVRDDFDSKGRVWLTFSGADATTQVITFDGIGGGVDSILQTQSIAYKAGAGVVDSIAVAATMLTGVKEVTALALNGANGAYDTDVLKATSLTMTVSYDAADAVGALHIKDVSGLITGLANSEYSTTQTGATTAAGTATLTLPAFGGEASAVAGTSNYQWSLGATLATDIGVVTQRAADDEAAKTTRDQNSVIRAVNASAVTLSMVIKNQFGIARANEAVAISIAGRNAQVATSNAVTDAAGRVSFTYTDAPLAGVTSTQDIITFNQDNGTDLTYTINWVDSIGVSKVVAYGGNTSSTGVTSATPTFNDITANGGAVTYGEGVETGAKTLTAKVTDASGSVLVGVPVTWSVAGTGVEIATNKVTTYTNTSGLATSSIYGWIKGTYTYTATAGGISSTGTISFAQTDATASDQRTITAVTSGTLVTATVKDRFGNPVPNVKVWATKSGAGYFGNGLAKTDGTTDQNGEVSFTVAGADADVTVATYDKSDVTAKGSGQTCALAGNVDCSATAPTAFDAYVAGTTFKGSTGVGASFAPAGVAEATVKVTGVQAATNAATAAAEAATDAAAEAVDAANAATDAANLAAEAADAATVAAEEARDAADAATAAVEELATQVATLMAALKAQITTLANTVAKIAKKVKA